MIKKIAAAIGMLMLMSLPVIGEENEVDPSDLMQTVNYLELSYEYQELNYGPLNGGIDILRLEYDWAPAPGNLLVLEGGFADSSVDEIGGSGIVDTRLRYFNLAWTLDESEEPGWKKAGFTIESYLPTGDIDKGTGFDHWVVAPGVVGAYQVTHKLRFYPILAYVYATPTDDFEDFTGINDDSHSISTEFYVTHHTESQIFYSLWHAGYFFGIDNTEDSSFVQSRLGMMLSETLTIGVDVQYNWAEDGGKPELGAEWIARIFVGTYAF
jgi:hypothetical protein